MFSNADNAHAHLAIFIAAVVAGRPVGKRFAPFITVGFENYMRLIEFFFIMEPDRWFNGTLSPPHECKKLANPLTVVIKFIHFNNIHSVVY